MINCVIIEDQAPAQRVLKKYISALENLSLIGTFSDAIQALEFLKSERVDLIFLDIHLPKISGVDFLKTLNNPPAVIFTTAFSEYAVQSYELNVADYLVKPFSFERFVKAVAKIIPEEQAAGKNSSGDESSFFIKSGHDFIKVDIDDILFIKSDMDYTEIYTERKKHLSNETLSHWESRLTPINFVRVHKSYLINPVCITKISGNQIYLKNNEIVPLGRVYKEEFFKRFVK